MLVEGKSETQLRLRVHRRTELAQDIVAFDLRDPVGMDLPAFEAGAHIEVHVADGSSRVRQYSLCNSPNERDRYLIAVHYDRAGRGGSRWLHESLHEGDDLLVHRPRNSFVLEQAEHVVLLAGGIGVTPLLAMAEVLTSQQRSFELHVYVRNKARLPFAQRLATAPFSDRVFVHDDVGRRNLGPHIRMILESAPAEGSLAYVCGPEGFITATQDVAMGLGWGDGRVVTERFGASRLPDPSNAELEVLWAPNGQRILVAANETVAQALIAAGIPVSLSCEQGICGQCCLQVIDGVPDHRDMVLTRNEHDSEGQFTPCCSRAEHGWIKLAPLDWPRGA